MENNEILTATESQEIKQETPNYNPPLYQPKPLFSLTKRDTVFAVCVVVACIFTAIFGIFGGFAFGYLLSVFLMSALFIIYLAKDGKASVLPILCGILAVLNSAVFICTTNGSVRFFSVVTSLLSALVFFDGFVNSSSKGNRETLGIFISAASTLENIDVAIKSLFSNENGSKKAIGKVLIGLLCALPVLAIVVPLLIASDDAFRGMMTNIFSNCISTILKTVFGVMLSVLVFTYGLSLKAGRVTKIKRGSFAGIENIYTISFLSTISVCYLLYLFSQLAYFFSAFKGFLPNGEITYAEYARKGFFEMCIIAVINLCLVFLALLLAKKENGKVCNTVKAITTFISVFTLLIIATAISKMVLYIDAYGMTVLRLTTSAFMLFLAITFISAILRIYTTKINIIKTALITAGCITLILGVTNVNAVCAKYNYEAYRLNKLETIDIEAIYDLGDEGIPYIVKLGASKDKDVAIEAQQYLAKAYLYDYFDNMESADFFLVEELRENQKDKGFERFSIPKSKAYDMLYKFIEKNPQFADNCQELYNELNQEYIYEY
ncbi:MAG: DUF4173 domain-containing protein [Clostridia bacterium]|nr:DUF4173 domain-containing protein [Clostridia bacterium]